EALITLLSAEFVQRDVADWEARLRAEGLPCAPINHVDEAFAHPQAQALDVIERILHPTAGVVSLVRAPFHLSETPAQTRRPPPTLAEHTHDVLRDVLGLGTSDIEVLQRNGSI